MSLNVLHYNRLCAPMAETLTWPEVVSSHFGLPTASLKGPKSKSAHSAIQIRQQGFRWQQARGTSFEATRATSQDESMRRVLGIPRTEPAFAKLLQICSREVRWRPDA